MEEEIKKRKYDETEMILTRIKSNYLYEWKKLLSENEQPYIFHDTILYLEHMTIFDFWKNNFDIEEKLHFNVHKQIHYELNKKCIPFILKIKNINGIVERGEEDMRNHYFRPTALLQSGLIFNIFAQIEDKAISELKVKYNNIIDYKKFVINCSQKIPTNRILYFRNLTVCFEEIKEIEYKRKKEYGINKYQIIAKVVDGEVLLDNKK